MTLTNWQKTTVIVDALIPSLCTLGIGIARYTNKITHSLFLTYFFGAFIGAFWEIPFGLAGDSFLVSKFDNPLGFGVHILHCFWDSIIFLLGMYWIHIRNDNQYCGLKQLGLLTLWGLFIEFIVELMYNDKYWYYRTDNRYNQVIFTIKGVSYTCIPYLVWILFPILYLSGVFSIIEKYGPLRKDGKKDLSYNNNESFSDDDAFYIESTDLSSTTTVHTL